MVSLINDLSLIGLQSLNATSGVVGAGSLRTENSPNFVSAQKSSRASPLGSVQSSLGNIADLRAIKMGLAAADTAVASAINAAEGVRETVLEMGAISVQAEADNIDQETRDGLIERFEALRERLAGQVDDATVGGVNLIAENAADVSTADSEGNAFKIEALGLGISHVKVTLESEAAASNTLLKKAVDTLDSRVEELEKTADTVGGSLEASRRVTGHVPNGVAELIDPDITLQDAELKAIDLRQRLGEQALAIANVDGFSLVGVVRQGSAGISKAVEKTGDSEAAE